MKDLCEYEEQATGSTSSDARNTTIDRRRSFPFTLVLSERKINAGKNGKECSPHPALPKK